MLTILSADRLRRTTCPCRLRATAALLEMSKAPRAASAEEEMPRDSTFIFSTSSWSTAPEFRSAGWRVWRAPSTSIRFCRQRRRYSSPSASPLDTSTKRNIASIGCKDCHAQQHSIIESDKRKKATVPRTPRPSISPSSKGPLGQRSWATKGRGGWNPSHYHSATASHASTKPHRNLSPSTTSSASSTPTSQLDCHSPSELQQSSARGGIEVYMAYDPESTLCAQFFLC